jgi:hypothetical protein
MVIVEILWHVRKGAEAAFLEAWRSKFLVKDRTHLFGEFLSKPDDSVEDIYKSWRLERFNEPSEGVTPYVNVAIWSSFDAFRQEIGPKVPTPGAAKADWEVHRYRVVLKPVAWRIGGWQPPGDNSPETL